MLGTTEVLVPELHVVGQDGGLLPMEATPFSLEVDFQALLELHPGLIPGELVDEDRPRHWLLIEREASIALGDADGSRGRVDHLFVDQDGWPTLVEIKRASDPRGRREVVAQMLDYAANMGAWEPGELRFRFEARCRRQGLEPADVVEELLSRSDEEPTSVDEFWSAGQANLDAGRMRLIFLSDRIRPELQRIIEFLNEHLDTIQVLGVEVKQWKSGETTAYSSNLVGQTVKAADRKRRATGTPTRISDSDFDDALAARAAPGEQAAVEEMFAWCVANGGFISYGQGKDRPAGYLNWEVGGSTLWPLIFIVAPKARHVRVPVAAMGRRFGSAIGKVEEFREALNRVEGISLGPQANPTFPLAVLADDGKRAAVCRAVSDLVSL